MHVISWYVVKINIFRWSKQIRCRTNSFLQYDSLPFPYTIHPVRRSGTEQLDKRDGNKNVTKGAIKATPPTAPSPGSFHVPYVMKTSRATVFPNPTRYHVGHMSRHISPDGTDVAFVSWTSRRVAETGNGCGVMASRGGESIGRGRRCRVRDAAVDGTASCTSPKEVSMRAGEILPASHFFFLNVVKWSIETFYIRRSVLTDV